MKVCLKDIPVNTTSLYLLKFAMNGNFDTNPQYLFFFFSTDYYLIFVEPDLCSAHPALCDDLSTLVCGINWSTSEGPFEPVPCWHCASCMDTGCSRTAISPALRKSPKGWNPFTKKFLTFYCKVFFILFFIIFFRSFTFRFCNCFSKNHKALGSLPVCEHTPS